MDTHKHHETHNSSSADFGKEVSGEFKEAGETLKEIVNPGKFDFGKEFKKAIEVAKLNDKKIAEVAAAKQSSLGAIIFIVFTIVVINLASYLFFFRYGFFGMAINTLLITALVSFVSFIIAVIVYDFVGSYLFKGKGNFKELFRVLGYGYIVMLLGIIPYITIVGSVWYLVITYKAISDIKKLNPTNTVLTILITIVVVAVLSGVLGMLFGYNLGSYYGLEQMIYR